MALCKSGRIADCCHPNALMTLKEYLEDYASEQARRTGSALIRRELGNIPNERIRHIASNVWRKSRPDSEISGFSRQFWGRQPCSRKIF